MLLMVSGTGQGTSPTFHNNSTPPFEEVILRKRGLGQDIVPSPNQPKRTESLFIPGQPNAQTAKVNETCNILNNIHLCDLIDY